MYGIHNNRNEESDSAIKGRWISEANLTTERVVYFTDRSVLRYLIQIIPRADPRIFSLQIS